MAKIEIKTTGIKGNSPKLKTEGQVVLFIDDAAAGDYICADAYIGSGAGYVQRKETLVEIRENYKVLFSGTFAELLTKLKS